ncbi:hypothetical protein DFO48_105547 [Comamonas sp. AG1104]|nr:hypothetical protein DFO48_105547 [Comamonas sp. AG1104]
MCCPSCNGQSSRSTCTRGVGSLLNEVRNFHEEMFLPSLCASGSPAPFQQNRYPARLCGAAGLACAQASPARPLFFHAIRKAFRTSTGMAPLRWGSSLHVDSSCLAFLSLGAFHCRPWHADADLQIWLTAHVAQQRLSQSNQVGRVFLCWPPGCHLAGGVEIFPAHCDRAVWNSWCCRSLAPLCLLGCREHGQLVCLGANSLRCISAVPPHIAVAHGRGYVFGVKRLTVLDVFAQGAY